MATGVDDLAVDPLGPGPDGVDSRTREQRRDLTDDPIGLEQDDRRQRRRAEIGRPLELQGLLEAGEQGAELGPVRPGRQHEGLEAILQLIIGAERQ